MAVKIRLKRMGKIRSPFYRVVVMDSRTKRDGRAIEEIGKYHPTAEPSVIDINSERAQYWLGVGAQPTEQVQALLKVTGDWQKFKGEPGAEGTLKPQPTKPSKKDLYEAAMAAAGKADDDYAKQGPATRKKAAKAEEPKAEEPKASAPEADAQPAAADVVEQATADDAEGTATVEVAAPGAEAAAVETPAEPAPADEAPAAEAAEKSEA
ncbi:MAG: 30S ribosomal protein S16 [Austwickia sp.]|nr:30S ribosomal protein S16 [Austwickia sp.]MCO5309670.1 30S ribosomal protein S16 [Austwickia sp.]